MIGNGNVASQYGRHIAHPAFDESKNPEKWGGCHHIL
jgi:hypothetical protein